jgi:hypothetical protein
VGLKIWPFTIRDEEWAKAVYRVPERKRESRKEDVTGG